MLINQEMRYLSMQLCGYKALIDLVRIFKKNPLEG